MKTYMNTFNNLTFRRAFTDKTGRIFSILYAERLDFNTSYFIENLFLNANIENREYKLVFVCGKESVARSYLATAFDKYKAQVPEFKDTTIRTYLERHLKTRGGEGSARTSLQKDQDTNCKPRETFLRIQVQQRHSNYPRNVSVEDLR